VLSFPNQSRVLALSLVALMVLAGTAIRPAAAIVSITPTPTFTLTGTPSLGGATAAIVENGNLWVADYGSNQIYEYAAPFTANEAPSVTLSVIEPQQLAFDSSGNLWVGTWSQHVYEFAAPISNGASPSVTLSGLVEPTGVTLYGGSLWVFDEEASSVYQYNPVPTSNSASPPAAILTPPGAIEGAFDSSGNLWVGEYDGTVAEYSSPVHSGESISATLTTTFAEVSSVALDGAGNLWVASPRNSGGISEFTAPLTNGETPTTPITISSSDSAWGVTIDSSGNIWVGDYIDRAVYEFSGLAVPFAPAAGPVPLPAIIPKQLTFNFNAPNTPTIIGNVVGLWGNGVMYNLPGYKAATDIDPYDVAFCTLPSGGGISITSFVSVAPGNNATELFVSYYYNTVTSAQGWPTEPACSN
jgi:ligand-binding sensor domain-containing protein